MMGALALVLGGLAGALWAVRRFDLRLPGRIGAAPRRERRLELVERITVDPRRSLVLVRRDGREHLLLIAPEGHLAIEAFDAVHFGALVTEATHA
jgi:flagellar biogenesis protein FliO